MACAGAGDTLSDANFDTKMAEECVLRLTAFEEWAKEMMDLVPNQPHFEKAHQRMKN